jgi:hyaluronan synthase
MEFPRHARPDHGYLDRAMIYCLLTAVLAVICAIKVYTAAALARSPLWGLYSVVVTCYIFSRFVLCWLYRPRLPKLAFDQLPSVAIIVPAYNEEAEIAATLRACLDVNYPAGLLRVAVVDDCSKDGTLARIREVQAARPELVVVASRVNKGKRHAMSAGLAAVGDAEILVFIDSDSRVEPNALLVLARYFSDPTVGAVAGHTDVWNRHTNLLTRMQAVRYYVAFRVYKSAEALFGCVTCCSGCFSGYRRAAVDPVLGRWLKQSFLGQPSTYGDDRSLTNYLLPEWRVLYAPDARAHTNVPDRLSVFLRQQLRWKKSWIRESLRACTFMWRKHPVMALSFYLGLALPLIAPQVAFRAFIVQPHFAGAMPLWYLCGISAMAALYGLYYRLHRRESLWYHGILFALFYTSVLVWQLPYALATIRDPKWGTR